MTPQLTLLIFCMIFPQAWSLDCYEFVEGVTDRQEKPCPDQCNTATLSIYTVDVKISGVNMKSCSTEQNCLSGSMNLGIVKITNNAKCCSTSLCNSEKPPALPRQDPNGGTCFTCDGNRCSKIMKCEGIEDRCITATGSNSVPMKGCVSKSFCHVSELTNIPGFDISNVMCCEGNLCNGAESFKLSFLLMLVPLLSSILFY